ncbi:hypothetical protein [Prauserella endophytica]|uniref:Uncharacterized protein n=1 Tax=Prauserella endophytica TaxID=1592324 RepID=A0ABY2RYX2_9PSEU|nr:hypothetical protein [Prauserella endophytica]TKG66192.1 hypothetical protein FCN18_25465 [Prauserella endophytica]
MIKIVEAPPRRESVEELRERLRARAAGAAALRESVPGAGENALIDLLAAHALAASEGRVKVMQEQAASPSGMIYRPASEPDAEWLEFEVPAEREFPESRVRVAEGWA